MMLLADHPFHVLRISPRSDKREIIKQAEELSLQGASEKIAAHRFQVTHPTKRLEAEVSWFPGVAPTRIRQLVDTINSESNLPQKIDDKLAGIDCLGKFNSLAYWLSGHADINPASWSLALHYVSKYAEDIEVLEVAETLNADRSAAGFPAITDVSNVANAIARHAEAAATLLADRLMQCPRHAEVLTLVVERETANGENQASEFINRFVDRYQIQVQPTLDRRAAEIAERCEELFPIAESSPGPGPLRALIAMIEKKLTEWDSVAQPIQLAMKARGLKDAHSVQLAGLVRRAAIRLANEYELHDEARRITAHLHEVFEEVPEVAEATEADSDALDEIISAKEERRRQDEEFREAIELDIMIGRDRLQINHQGIAYNGRRLALEEVTRLRWGIYKRYLNGVRTSREFTIWVGAKEPGRGVVIECVRFMESEETVLERYATILDKLWRAVGVRVLIDLAAKLMAGESVAFGEAVATKAGMWLPKRKWFSSERYFAPWEELRKGSRGGSLWIGSDKESNASVSLGLRDIDNAVVLERLLDILWKDGNHVKLREGRLFQEDSEADDTEESGGVGWPCHHCGIQVIPTDLRLCPYCGRRL